MSPRRKSGEPANSKSIAGAPSSPLQQQTTLTRRLFNSSLIAIGAMYKQGFGAEFSPAPYGNAPDGAGTQLSGGRDNLVGINFPAGGSAALSYEGLPIFRNRIRESRGFTTIPGTEAQVPLSPQGWPIADFACVLYEGHVIPSWVGAGKKPFKCGFIGAGTEVISGNGSARVSNIVHGMGGRYTTFDLWMTGGGGFNVAGTATSVINIYAYLPDYPQVGIDDPLQPSAFTREAISHYSQFHHIRWMEAQGAVQNTFLCRSSNRRTARNTQANQGSWGQISLYGIGSVVGTATGGSAISISDSLQSWRPDALVGRLVWNSRSGDAAKVVSNGVNSLQVGSPMSANRAGDKYVICLAKGDSAAVLKEPWAAPSGTIILTFPDAAFDGVACNVTHGSMAVSLLKPLPATVTQPFITGGVEGYPVEWAASFCKACNVGLWVCLPIFEDGPNGTSGSYSDEVLGYLARELSGDLPLYLEISNEIWNPGSGVFRAWRSLAAQSGLDGSQYIGMRYHDLADACRRHFPKSFAKSVFQVAAWQSGGGGLNGFTQILSYMESKYGAPRADVQFLAIAPYADPGYLSYESVTSISRSSPAVIGIDSRRDSNPLTSGNTVDFANFEGLHELNGRSATVLAVSGSAGNYSATVGFDTRQIHGDIATGTVYDSAETILKKISASTQSSAVRQRRLSENIAVMALHYGMKLCSYESGIEWNATPNTFRNPHTNPNVADVAMGEQCGSALSQYYQTLFDSGFELITHFADGVATADGGFGSDELSNNYASYIAHGSPMLAALQKYMRGFVPTRNVVDARGSSIHGSNYADNFDESLPTLGIAGAYKLAPYELSDGYLPYILHCKNPGQYQISLTTSNAHGRALTNLEINGQILFRNIVVSDGDNRIGIATLLAGLNYILLGTGKVTSAQSGCTIRAIEFV